MIESEDWRQLRLHALESLAARLTETGRLGGAIHAALAVVNVEPLRESAQATLIRAHLGEGNQADALRVYERYERHLQTELGMEPTPGLRDLVRGLQ